MRISHNDWLETYKPQKNHLNTNASFDGTMYEIYGEEVAYVVEQPHSKVWTVLDCDGKLVISSGYHRVNRMGYIITEVAYDGTETIEVIDEDDNPNENCLAGMRCPECGDFGPFMINVTQSQMTMVTDEGHDEVGGDSEWDDDSVCRCIACGHESKVRQFCGKPEPSFDECQQVVVEHYDDGQHAVHEPADVENCGDGLLRFLMVELSANEDCDSFNTAVYRLDTAIRQLTNLRSVFIQKALS